MQRALECSTVVAGKNSEKALRTLPVKRRLAWVRLLLGRAACWIRVVVGELRPVRLRCGSVSARVRPVQRGRPAGSKGCRVNWILEQLIDAGGHVAPVGGQVTGVGCIVAIVAIVAIVGIGKSLLLAFAVVG